MSKVFGEAAFEGRDTAGRIRSAETFGPLLNGYSHPA